MAAWFTALEGKMKKKRLLLWMLLLVVLTSEGCATIRGMGEDIQSIGRGVKRAVSGG
jgi:predicted small secreted protein